ncbi:hypothetical protein ABBQ38_011630 [Trebouxia sp. C0009 RCD-2024]
MASQALVSERLPQILLCHAESVLQGRFGQSYTWSRPDGTIDEQQFGRLVSNLRDRSLRRSLFKLKEVASKSEADQTSALLTCEGPGIMCAAAAALPDRFLEGPMDDENNFLPPESVESDMRGRVNTARTGEFAYIDLGEVKRKVEYADAVAQLGLTLATVGWFVQVCCKVPKEKTVLAGCVFVPKASKGDRLVEADQRDAAASDWGYSLHLHSY